MRKLHHAILKGTPAWPTTLEKWRPVACLDCHPGHPLRRLELLRVASTCRWECQTACSIRAKRSRSCPARCVCLGGWRDSLPWRTHRPKLNRESSSSGMLLPHRMTRMPMDTLTFSLLSRLKSIIIIIIWVHAVYDVYEIWLIYDMGEKNCPFQRLQKHHDTSEIVLCQTFDIFRGDSSRLSRLSWWLFALSRSWVIRLTRWCSNSISNKEDTASAGTNECHRSMASAPNDKNIQTSWMLTDGVFNRKSLFTVCWQSSNSTS